MMIVQPASVSTGGSVPAGRWRVAAFAELADAQGRARPAGDSAWRNSARVPGAPTVAACRTEQGYNAIVEVTQSRTQQNDLRLQAWFQSVQGLHLLRH